MTSKAQRLKLSPVSESDLATLIDLGLVEVREGAPVVNSGRSRRLGLKRKDFARRLCRQPLAPTSFANVSRRPIVRLNTGRSGVESGSRAK
jgi:hypothetical protein